MADFAIYLDAEIRTNKVRTSLAAGMLAAAQALKTRNVAAIFGKLGVSLANKLVFTSVVGSKEAADFIFKEGQLILSGPRSGKIYTTEWRTNRQTGRPFPLRNVPLAKAHQASAPGEAPARFTDELFKSLAYEIIHRGDKTVIRFGTPLKKGRQLELGESPFVLPRPWMRPLRSKIISDGRFTDVVVMSARRRARGGLATSLSGLFSGLGRGGS